MATDIRQYGFWNTMFGFTRFMHVCVKKEIPMVNRWISDPLRRERWPSFTFGVPFERLDGI